MMPNRAWEFENFLRFEMPWMLNLSTSKQVATEIQFTHLADFVDSLIKKAPKEFDFFFSEFQKNLIKISKWRVPKGTKIVPVFYKGNISTFSNGKLRYHLGEKPNKKPTKN